MNNSFNFNPDVEVRRSRFNMNYIVKDAFCAGQLVPLGTPIEIVPGDTFDISLKTFVRMTPSIKVPLDNMIFQTWWFFVPKRIVWTNFKNFIGEQNVATAPWRTNSAPYREPIINLYSGTTYIAVKENSILSHMGVPSFTRLSSTTSSGNTIYDSWVNALPVRSYCCIWNNFFRDQNYQYPCLYQTGDTPVTYSPSTGANWVDSAVGNDLLPLNRFHDYFSDLLPSPQRGDPVRLPLNVGTSLSPVNMFKGLTTGNSFRLVTSSGGSTLVSLNPSSGASESLTLNDAIMGSIDQFRIAYLTQEYLYRLGTGGSRYTEILKNIFGTTAPDYLTDRPVLLGATSFMINMTPVVQSSASESTTFDTQSLDEAKGSVSGYSATFDSSYCMKHSFVEHGYLVPVYGVRYERSYSQGLHILWRKRDFLDYYNPIFANIGSQPVYTFEIFAGATGVTSVSANSVFGYKEAWAEYRFIPNQVNGILKLQSYLEPWTYADFYSSTPTLSSGWLKNDYVNLNRTLYVAGNPGPVNNAVPQFLVDFGVKCVATRPIPVHSIPDLDSYF